MSSLNDLCYDVSLLGCRRFLCLKKDRYGYYNYMSGIGKVSGPDTFSGNRDVSTRDKAIKAFEKAIYAFKHGKVNDLEAEKDKIVAKYKKAQDASWKPRLPGTAQQKANKLDHLLTELSKDCQEVDTASESSSDGGEVEEKTSLVDDFKKVRMMLQRFHTEFEKIGKIHIQKVSEEDEKGKVKEKKVKVDFRRKLPTIPMEEEDKLEETVKNEIEQLIKTYEAKGFSKEIILTNFRTYASDRGDERMIRLINEMDPPTNKNDKKIRFAKENETILIETNEEMNAEYQKEEIQRLDSQMNVF